FSDNNSSHDLPSVHPLINHHCCYECGNSLDDFFCYQCTCKFYGNGAHVGYNCPAQVPSVQTLPSFPQQYLCCEDSRVTHEPYQCQPKKHDYYNEQDSCFDSNSFSFDQSQPQQYTINHHIFNAHNDYLDSQIQLNSTLAKITEQMKSITSLCEMACEFVQKKLEEKQLEEERAAKTQNWKLPVCYDDDDDEERSDSLDDNIISGLPPFSAIIPNEPVLSTEEPDNSLSMRDEHLETILATKSDEVIKSSVENLIPIPSESEGIPEHMCDVPSHDNSPPLDVSKDQFEDFSKSNEEFSSTDDDSFSFDKIDYVEASPPDSELASSEVMEIVIPEVGEIKASNDNPIPFYDPIISGTPPNLTPSGESDFFLETKSSSTSLNSLLEETNNFDNSLPEFTTFLNVRCDAEYESDSSDDHSCSDEDVIDKIISKPLREEEIIPMKSLRTHDSSLPISSKIDSLLDEFAGELTLLKSISPGIDETGCDFEEDIRLIEKLFNSLMEEIDLLCTPDYPMPPGIVDKDYDSERDILILKDLPSNNTLSFAEKESFHFDIPPFSRPSAKPPDGDTGILNIKMMGDIYDQKALMHKLMITLGSHQEKSPDLLSHRGLKASQPFATCPMMIHGQNNPILDVLLFHFYPP
nr:hypothetical protein [Tanacetum cinerariifolium]